MLTVNTLNIDYVCVVSIVCNASLVTEDRSMLFQYVLRKKLGKLMHIVVQIVFYSFLG